MKTAPKTHTNFNVVPNSVSKIHSFCSFLLCLCSHGHRDYVFGLSLRPTVPFLWTQYLKNVWRGFFFSNVHLDTRMNWLGFAHFSPLLSRTVIRTTFYTNVEEDQVMKWRHVISKRSEVNFIIIFSKKKCSIQRQRSGAETRSVRGGTQPRGSKCSCAWNAYCWSAPKQKGKNPRMWNPAWK